MQLTIIVLAGDGIGQEVMTQALRVLDVIGNRFNINLDLHYGEIGGAAFDSTGQHFPDATAELCKQHSAVLFGSVGGPVAEAHLPKWQNCEKNSILALRKALQLSANLRPITVFPELTSFSPLQAHLINKGVDLLIVRELLGDIYFGEHKQWQESDGRHALDVAEYSEKQITSVAHRAFQLASQRRGLLTSVDKANVLETSRLWRTVINEISNQYPDVTLEHMLVDNCAMQLILKPAQFDVIVTANLFGDILSDTAAALPGSLGLIPSASLNAHGGGLYEPAGGSAPDIAGKNIANPIAQILSLALLLRHSFQLEEAACCIEQAVQKTLRAGIRTQDISNPVQKGVTCSDMTDVIITYL